MDREEILHLVEGVLDFNEKCKEIDGTYIEIAIDHNSVALWLRDYYHKILEWIVVSPLGLDRAAKILEKWTKKISA